MPRATPDAAVTKFQCYRRAQQTRGLKLLRVWVPDPKNVGFRAEASRQAALLRGAPEKADALNLIEAATDWPDA